MEAVVLAPGNPAGIPVSAPTRVQEGVRPRDGAGLIEAFFAPKAVAVVGGTERDGTVGRALLENLASFPGPVHVVHPTHRTVMGRPAVPHFRDLPDGVDVAVIATPAAGVPALVREAGERGIRSVIVISAGFKEAGEQGIALEQATLAAACEHGVRLIGPNCLGVMSPHLGFNATFAAGMARPGHVAFLSQSGALCTALLDWSLRENVGFSAFVSLGSMSDVAWGELLRHFADDPATHSIVCYLESVGDASAFLSAAQAVSCRKPMIALKVGRTEAASRAAASHTGAMTGSDAVLDAAFRRAGVLRVETIGELFNVAEALAKQPAPRGSRLAILTNAGGPGALSTDLLVRTGGRLADLPASTIDSLSRFLPGPWSHANPVDILGDADAERYSRAASLLLADPAVDGLLVILTPQHMTDPAAVARRIAGLVQLSPKPILASWMGGRVVSPGREVLNEAGIPTFDYPDAAARAFVRMSQTACSPEAAPVDDLPPMPDPDREAAALVESILAGVRSAGRTLLTEVESKQVLSAYGIPMNPTRAALTEDEAVAAACELGFPVAIKLLSETVTHKSDVGGVRLGIVDADGARTAFRAIRESVGELVGPGHFGGVTVQPMIPSNGHELILGSLSDPQFGPVLMFGTGGRWVEVYRDTALELPPMDAGVAARWRERTLVNRALRGFRGEAPVNLDRLDEILVRFAALAASHPRIAEMDINPLHASASRIVALDARVVLHRAGIPDEALPRPALLPSSDTIA
jgi:acetyltransferase